MEGNVQKEMYLTLFNRITDVIDLLQQAQKATEELYLSESEDNCVTTSHATDDI